MICARCGAETPRLTLTQRYCVPCGIQVATITLADQRRRRPRFALAKDLTGDIVDAVR